ncbi:MAG TPA: biotin/lipoate A/B protein ligase family protein [Candidatus Dormibacteraeota bacterium]
MLLDAVAAGRRGPSLRIWVWSGRALVIGSHQSVANEVDSIAAAELGFEVVRRMSGGGTMVCEEGRTFTYSLYLPDRLVAGMTFVESFAYLDAWVVQALRARGVPAGYRPINDLVSPEGKIAGAAQTRRRGHVLHHTTGAHEIDPAIVPRLIRIGRPPLVERGVRSAEKRVTPLRDYLDVPLPEVLELLAEAAGGRRESAAESELAAARVLAERKYATPEWTYRLP